jgi:predicted amidophosphoribosyltransferase
VITVVPSSSQRDGAHPLERVIAMAEPLAERFREALRRGDGPLGHNQASDTGYVVTDDIAGVNVLLVDDTFTTGARIQSAASALALAGAYVVAAIPIGRFISPGFNEATAVLWETARAKRFDFDRCCLEPRRL